MKKKFKFIAFATFIVLLNFCSLNKVNAQSPAIIAKLDLVVDSLKNLSESTANAKTDEERSTTNNQFSKTLNDALKVQSSYFYTGFDSLKNISVLKSPDNLFKVVTWYLAKTDGTYQYFGCIQVNTRNGIPNLISLLDDSENIKDVNAVLTAKKWFGARYYEIIPVTALGKPPYYLLLGWKGNTEKTTKKVIEVLSFDKNESIFGKPIFELSKNGALRNRAVFEYFKQNTMTLTFNKTVNMLVFDHLVPFDKSYIGNFEYYASDSTFDGYVISYGKLTLKEDVELKNDPTANDEFYGTPVKATTILRSNH